MQYPLQLRFKVFALASQIYVNDAEGSVVLFVKQKLFKLKEDIRVFGDEEQRKAKFTIKADRVLDFSASYAFTTPDGTPLGSVKRKGMRSLWRASYEIYDAPGTLVMTISEENPWIKVLDTLVADIPYVGIFTGFIFNPSYLIKLADGSEAMRLSKKASFLERRFEVDKLMELTGPDEHRAILGGLMMVLLERSRG